MGYIRATFLGKEYSIPEDVLIYIDLLDFTANVKTQLVNVFVRKLKAEIAKDNIGLLGDEDLASEIEQQVGKFIAKLCDNGIFTRTIRDYLTGNKGYQLISDVNKAALEKMKSQLLQELDAWQAGYEDAVNRAESHVTGMGFSIWSSSFVNHAIYAAMEASTLNKQGKEAEVQYQRDMTDLRSRLDSKYGGEKSKYINNTYIPNMEAALTVFAYELLDKYVADLIANGKFESKTLDYVDIGRSNDLLKNLTLSNNKQAILENAFAACPYNIAVYMQAMKYDLLDFDSFQTAKVFKQDHQILSFFKESWGEVSFPSKFNINYHCINVWATLTGKTSTDLLRDLTEKYALGIIKAYSRVADIMADKTACRKIIGELREDAILSGESICVGKAREYVEPIVHATTWEQLTERCGHTDLLSRIEKCFPSVEELQSKKDFDRCVTKQLATSFENERKELAEHIEARRAELERQRIEQEQQKAELERIAAEKKAKKAATHKKRVKRMLTVITGVAVALILLIIAGIIYLAATNKPIDDDFDKRTEYSVQNLNYYVPSNWLLDSAQSKDNINYHVRYDNWGKYLCVMAVQYRGETSDVSVQDIVASHVSGQMNAVVEDRDIGNQVFSVITYIREEDNNYCNVYVTEIDASVFMIYFRSLPESNKPAVFEEIVSAIAFDEYVNPKEDAYNEAIDLMAAGKYADALSAFNDLNGFRDSNLYIDEIQEILDEALYVKATEQQNAGQYEAAFLTFQEILGYKNSSVLAEQCMLSILRSAEVGDTVYFGSHEQDANDQNGPESIEWKVLAKENGRLLLISKYLIDWKKFDTDGSAMWEKCALRDWLNTDFFGSAFSFNEQALIINTQNTTNSSISSQSTIDKVFLLSKEEAYKYFRTDRSRICEATQYAISKANTSDKVAVRGLAWLLRSAGAFDQYVQLISDDGTYSGDTYTWAELYIRPALWINLDDAEESLNSAPDAYVEISTPSLKVDESTIANIDFACNVLGRKFDSNYNLKLSDEEYAFLSNEVELFGMQGRFVGAYTDEGEAKSTIDMLDWTTIHTDYKIDSVINVLLEMYGTQYKVDESHQVYSGVIINDVYAWMDLDKYKCVMCWKNPDGTITIRWIADID